jgi:hypothetical protein
LLADKEAVAAPATLPIAAPQQGGVSVSQLTALRDRLRDALGG